MTTAEHVRELENAGHGWRMVIGGVGTATELWWALWPDGGGDALTGIHIEEGMVQTEPHVEGEFTITGLTPYAVRAMQDDFEYRFTSAGFEMADAQEDATLHPGHPHWDHVTGGLVEMASNNLHVMVQWMGAGGQAFRDDADTMIGEYIKEPPKSLGAFEAIADAVVGAVGVFIPVGHLAAEIYEAVKIVYDQAKLAKGVWDTAGEIQVARDVEGAKDQLRQLTKQFAEDFAMKSIAGYQASLSTLHAKVLEFLHTHPQPVPTDENWYAATCQAMGLGATYEDSAHHFAIELMKPFRKAVMTQTATLHFFHELDDDVERLDFLIQQEQQGNQPEALLQLIGADVAYWKKYLDIYRAQGEEAAKQALLSHLMGRD